MNVSRCIYGDRVKCIVENRQKCISNFARTIGECRSYAWSADNDLSFYHGCVCEQLRNEDSLGPLYNGASSNPIYTYERTDCLSDRDCPDFPNKCNLTRLVCSTCYDYHIDESLETPSECNNRKYLWPNTTAFSRIDIPTLTNEPLESYQDIRCNSITFGGKNGRCHTVNTFNDTACECEWYTEITYFDENAILERIKPSIPPSPPPSPPPLDTTPFLPTSETLNRNIDNSGQNNISVIWIPIILGGIVALVVAFAVWTYYKK